MSETVDYVARAKAIREKFFPTLKPTVMVTPRLKPGTEPVISKPLVRENRRVELVKPVRRNLPPHPWYWGDLDKMTSSIRARAIKYRVADRYHLEVGDLDGNNRRAYVVKARWEAIAKVAQANPNWSLPRIGQFFGKDHTTVLHALRKMGVTKPRAASGPRGL